MRALGALAIAAVSAFVACASGDAKDTRFPSRPVGCDVKIFHATPDVPSENIGPVQVKCGEDVSEADCLRELADVACGMGADVVWGIGDEAMKKDGRNAWYGRAAHTKAPAPAGSGRARAVQGP